MFEVNLPESPHINREIRPRNRDAGRLDWQRVSPHLADVSATFIELARKVVVRVGIVNAKRGDRIALHSAFRRSQAYVRAV